MLQGKRKKNRKMNLGKVGVNVKGVVSRNGLTGSKTDQLIYECGIVRHFGLHRQKGVGECFVL